MSHGGTPPGTTDPRSGYNRATATFVSKHPSLYIPTTAALSVTAFISSLPHLPATAFVDASSNRSLSNEQLWHAVNSLSYSIKASKFPNGSFDHFTSSPSHQHRGGVGPTQRSSHTTVHTNNSSSSHQGGVGPTQRSCGVGSTQRSSHTIMHTNNSSSSHQGGVGPTQRSSGVGSTLHSSHTFANRGGFVNVKKNDVVLVLSHNSIYLPIIYLAVMNIGAAITAANPVNTRRELMKQVEQTRPVLVFAESELVGKLDGFDVPIVLLDDGGEVKGNVVGRVEEMMSGGTSQGRVDEVVTQDDTATLFFSSGTTGESKGVVSSHGNMIAMVQVMAQRFSLDSKGERFICTVPMFHFYGLALALGVFAAGFTIVIQPKFEMDGVLRTIEKYKVSHFPLVPPIIVAMVNNADQIKKKYDLSSLKCILSGGAPLSKEVVEGFLQKYPQVEMIRQGYGLTESTAMGTSSDTVEASRKYGTAGLLSASMEAKIVDPESGKALGINQAGEIWLRGPTIMKGYLNNPEATALTIDPEGWLKTGDLCYIDDDGFLFVVGRLKELIKYKAYQVAPAELEALLLSHPEIVDAAVIPFPDREAGQIPMAYIVRKSGSLLSDTAVMDFIAKEVAPYKKIRRVAFVESIPKNPSGKILRKDLIQLATSKL